MVIRLVIWSLADSLTNVGELRRYLRDEAVPAFERVPALLFKGWFSDEATERWGAVYVWASREASEQELPSRARELIGKNPDIVEIFDNYDGNGNPATITHGGTVTSLTYDMANQLCSNASCNQTRAGEKARAATSAATRSPVSCDRRRGSPHSEHHKPCFSRRRRRSPAHRPRLERSCLFDRSRLFLGRRRAITRAYRHWIAAGRSPGQPALQPRPPHYLHRH